MDISKLLTSKQILVFQFPEKIGHIFHLMQFAKSQENLIADIETSTVKVLTFWASHHFVTLLTPFESFTGITYLDTTLVK